MILNWNNDFMSGDIANEVQRVDITEKPELSFIFEHINVDEMNQMKMVENNKYELTNDELENCMKYVEAFDFPQIPVHVIDINGFYDGQRMPSEISDSLTIVETPPPHPSMVYEKGEWTEVFLMVDNLGQPIINPGDLEKMAYFWTKNNPPERMPKRFEIWDFDKQEWKESRTLDKAIYNAKAYERENNSQRIYEIIGKWIPMLELETWRIQEAEASNYSVDPETPTPFIDACLEARSDSQTKNEFVQEIIANADGFKKAVGKAHGEMYNRLNAFEACETVAEVDALGGTDPEW